MEVDTRGGCKEGIGEWDVFLVRGGGEDDGSLIGYMLIVDGGVGGWDMRGGTHCTCSWDRGGDDREVFKLLKSGLSKPGDKRTERQELRGWGHDFL